MAHDGNGGREAFAIEESGVQLDRIQHAQASEFALGGLDRDAKRFPEVRATLTPLETGHTSGSVSIAKRHQHEADQSNAADSIVYLLRGSHRNAKPTLERGK